MQNTLSLRSLCSLYCNWQLIPLENTGASPKQCCGSGMFIPDPNFFHPSGSASKNLNILTQIIVSNLSEIWSGLFIPDPDHEFLPIPDPGVKKAPGPGSRSATLFLELTPPPPHTLSHPLCVFAALTARVMAKLKEAVTVAGLRLWVCLECGFSRPDKWHVSRHVEQKHMGLRVRCGLCYATFTRRDKLRAHVKAKHE